MITSSPMSHSISFLSKFIISPPLYIYIIPYIRYKVNEKEAKNRLIQPNFLDDGEEGTVLFEYRHCQKNGIRSGESEQVISARIYS